MLDCQLGEDGQLPKSRSSPKEARRGERRKFVGFSEHLKLARVKKEQKTGADAWLTRKVRCSRREGAREELGLME